MDVVALVLAVMAIVVAALSAKFTHDQAEATKAQAIAASDQLKIIGQQWHSQRRPRIHARYHMTDNRAHEAITFTNTGPVDLSQITIELGMVGHQLLDGLAGSSKLDHVGPWPIGTGESCVINRARPDGGTIGFRFTCIGVDINETWIVPVECQIDAAPGGSGPTQSLPQA